MNNVTKQGREFAINLKIKDQKNNVPTLCKYLFTSFMSK